MDEGAEDSPLRLTTPPSAYELVSEVETDVKDSGAQSGSISDSWLVMLVN